MIIRELTTFDLDVLLDLYNSVGWTNYTSAPDMLKKAYENSLLTLGAYDGSKLVGIIRTVGDGFSAVYRGDGRTVAEMAGNYLEVFKVCVLDLSQLH